MRTTKPSRHANHFQATRRRVSQITVLTRAPRQTGNPKRCGAAGRNRLRDAKRAYRREIDESFRDDKSGGLDMAHTRSQHPERLERLLLAVALATLWCHELGQRGMSQGESIRRTIDPGSKRELSLFQLGLRWLRRCIANAIHLGPVFAACRSPTQLAPVVKSGDP